MICIVAPRRPVVHHHAFRQAVPAEDVGEPLTNRLGSFIATCLQPQRKAGVVIQHGESMATALPQCKVPFEVHLPQLVGLQMLKALPSPVFGALGRIYPAMTPQYGGDRAWARQQLMPPGRQPGPQLTPAPGRMSIPYFQHHLFNLRPGASRGMMRASRQINQPSFSVSTEPLQPLIASRRADAKAAALLSQVSVFPLGQLHKLFPLRHHGHLFPRHAYLHTHRSCQLSAWCPPCLRTCVSYVPGPYTPLQRGIWPVNQAFDQV